MEIGQTSPPLLNIHIFTLRALPACQHVQWRRQHFLIHGLLIYPQRYQGYHSGHSVPAHHQPGAWPEGTQLQAPGHSVLPGEGGGWKAAHQPPDHLPSSRRLQPPSRCQSPGKILLVFPMTSVQG